VGGAMLKALARHSYWNAVATFAYQGSTFLSNFLVIKLLDHASYGKFSLLNLTAFYAAAILQFAIGSTTSRFVARYADKQEQLLSVIGVCAAFSIASGLVGFGILIVGSGVLSAGVFAEPTLATPIAIVSLSLPSLVALVFLNGLLQGLHEFRMLAIASVVSGLLFITVVGAGAWVGGLDGAIVGFAAGSTIRSIVVGATAIRQLRKSGLTFSWRSLLNGPIRRELVSFQLPAGLAGCVTTPTLWLIPAILTRNTQNFGDVATYSVLLMIKSLIVLPASVISLALQPSAEKALGSNHVSTALKVFRTASIVSIAVVASAALVFAVLAKHVLTVFGQDFASETAPLQVMMIAAVAEAAAICLYMRIQATNRMWASIAATLLPRDFAMLAIVVMFTSKYGLWAAIIAHVTGALVNLAGAYWLSVRSLPLKPL
jgi:O-antigen/teichoic acid export membrane protein